MTDTWTDRDDYDQSAADHLALFDEMQRTWTWPAPRGLALPVDYDPDPTPPHGLPRPRLDDAATCDDLEAANLDPTGRTYQRSDWQHEVREGDTCLGYDEWVAHQREADGARDLDGLTPLERAALEVGIADDAARRARDAWCEALPPLADGYRCTGCGRDDCLSIHEIGYERFTTLQVEINDADADDIAKEGTLYLSASPDGWDDISEGGTHQWILCMHCTTAHRDDPKVEW